MKMQKQAKANVAQIRQTTQYTCCAASIASALQAWGKNVTEDDVNRILGAAPMSGAAWETMLATVQYFGMRGTLVVPTTIAMLKKWTDAGVPVVIGWTPRDRPWAHASVVFDVDDTHVHVMDPNLPDPAQTTWLVPHADFYAKWFEKHSESMYVRRPAMAIEREVTSEGRQVIAKKKSAPVTTSPKKGPITIDIPHSQFRNEVERQRAQQGGGKSGGPHKNREKAVSEGRSRKPKHKKPWTEKEAIARIAQAYSGNPDGKPIYPNEIDHGYAQPLSGGTDVMKRLQNNLLHEQGHDDLLRPTNPKVASDEKQLAALKDLQKVVTGKDIAFIQGSISTLRKGQQLSEEDLKKIRYLLHTNKMEKPVKLFKVAGKPEAGYIFLINDNAGPGYLETYTVGHSVHDDPAMGFQALKVNLDPDKARLLAQQLKQRWKLPVIEAERITPFRYKVLKAMSASKKDSAMKLSEASDCLQDYQAGALTREEYEECVERAEGGGGYSPHNDARALERYEDLERKKHDEWARKNLLSKPEREHLLKQVKLILIALKMDPTPNKNEAVALKKILDGAMHRDEKPVDKAHEVLEALTRRYAHVTRQMPEGIQNNMKFPFGGVLPYTFGESRNPKHIAFVSKFWNGWQVDGSGIEVGDDPKTPQEISRSAGAINMMMAPRMQADLARHRAEEAAKEKRIQQRMRDSGIEKAKPLSLWERAKRLFTQYKKDHPQTKKLPKDFVKQAMVKSVAERFLTR